MQDGRQLHEQPAASVEQPFQYTRMLRRLPANVRASLTDEQLNAISDALIQDTPSHAVDYRVSVPFFGRRYYITLLAGKEKRSLARLAREAQLHAKRIAAFYSVLLVVLGCVSFVGLVLLGYLLKSALDIDLMDGPSILHQYFFTDPQAGMQGQAGDQAAVLMAQIPKI